LQKNIKVIFGNSYCEYLSNVIFTLEASSISSSSSLPSCSGKRKLENDDDDSSKHNSTGKKLKIELESNQEGCEDIIEYFPEKVKPAVITLDDSCDSESFQVKNQVTFSSATFKKNVKQSTRPKKYSRRKDIKVSIEEIELQRKKRPKITYFKLVSDAFVESNNTWLNCEQICKRITQKHAYFRDIDIKVLKRSVYPILARKNLFNKYKPIKQFKMYSLIKSANPLAITAPEKTQSFEVNFKVEMSYDS
jgi:hypothetical protein